MITKKNCVAILLAMVLTACYEKPNISEIEAKIEAKAEQKKPDQQSSPTDALKAFDKTLSAGVKDFTAKDVKFDTYVYSYELPEAMKQVCQFEVKNTDEDMVEQIDICTQVDIALVKVEPKWIEQVINKAITNDDGVKLLKFKQTLDEFVGEHLMVIEEFRQIAQDNNEEFSSAPIYAWHTKPRMLPAFNNIAQFAINSDFYTGGAHSTPNEQYLIFDMDLQSQIQLGDIIVKDKDGDLFDLAQQFFKDYLKTELELKTEREIKDYEESWAFILPENFYFHEKGLVFVYQPYEIGSYAQGFIELTLPYENLTGIIRERYLPKQPL